MDKNLKKVILSLFLAIIVVSSAFAQNSDLKNSVHRLKYDFSQFGNETWDFIKQPTKWDGSDWIKLVLIGGGTFLIVKTTDQPVRDVVLKNQQYYNSLPIKIGNIWGDWYPTVIIGSAFALHGLVGANYTSRKIAFEILQAGFYTEVITQIIKHSLGRARPYNKLGPNYFKPFSFLGWDFTSMPAGHTSWAFSLSTVLSRNAKQDWLKVAAYIPAVLTFVSRVYQDQHWTSDDFLGAALGYFIATWVVDQHENNESIVEMSSIYPISIRIVLN